ncbi:MAG: hypothetical protein HY907_07960 [Deltaproteobacteria bacterium]|nr:hypothetical protein [Deltaproteobacteria bacterium]
MKRLLRGLGCLCFLFHAVVVACQDGDPDGGTGGTGVSYLPSDSLQPGEFVRVALESPVAASYEWSVAVAPAGASYELSPDGVRALFRPRAPGDYRLRAVPAVEGSGLAEQTAAVRVAEPACEPLGGTLIGIAGSSPNRFVHVDPCTGVQTPLADVGDPSMGFPQGIYAVDPDARRLYLQRSTGGELHLLGLDADTGAVTMDVVVPPPALTMIEVDPGAGGLLVVTGDVDARLKHVDPGSGTLDDAGSVGSMAGVLQGIYAVDPGRHRLYFLRGVEGDNVHLVAVDTRTAAPVVDVALSVPHVGALRFDAVGGVLFGVTGCCPNEFAAIDPATGEVEPRAILGDSTVGFPQGINGVASEDHAFIFERSEIGGSGASLVVVDTRTGSQRSSVPRSGGSFMVLEYVPAP